MRVALVHDDLVQWGGAERVLLGLSEIYPDAPIFTSVFDYSNNQLAKKFASKKIITSFLQKVPGWKSLYKVLLPLYPIAFEQFDFSEYDLVISHTTRFAKSVITKPKTFHISYCHTPPRFLWDFSDQSYPYLEFYLSKLRIHDQVWAKRVDFFIAGSENTRGRIKKVYGIDSKVVYPFVDLKRFENTQIFDGGYYLVISRLNKYKRVDMALEACLRLGLPLKIIGSGPELEGLKRKGRGGKVEFFKNVDDRIMTQILAGCRALIIPGVEDFGLVSLEAQAMGKSVIAYKGGGVMEATVEGVTGYFFDKPNQVSLADVLRQFDDSKIWYKVENQCRQNAARFSLDIFQKAFKKIASSLVY